MDATINSRNRPHLNSGRQNTFEHRIYLYTGLCLFFLFLVAIVGFASPAWRAGDYGQRQYVETGLIIRCYHDLKIAYHRCAPFVLGSQVAWFEVSRVSCALSLVLTFTLIVSAVFLHVVDKKRNDHLFLLAGAMATASLGAIGAIVFAAMSDSILSQYKANLSWGWAIFFVAQLLLLTMAIAFIVIIRKSRRKPRPRPVAPIRDVIF